MTSSRSHNDAGHVCMLRIRSTEALLTILQANRSSGTYPRIAIRVYPVPSRSCSDVTLRVPFGCGPGDAAQVVWSSLIRGPGSRSAPARWVFD